MLQEPYPNTHLTEVTSNKIIPESEPFSNTVHEEHNVNTPNQNEDEDAEHEDLLSSTKSIAIRGSERDKKDNSEERKDNCWKKTEEELTIGELEGENEVKEEHLNWEKEMKKEVEKSAPIFSKVRSIFKKYFMSNFNMTVAENNYQKYPYQEVEQNSITFVDQTINSIVAEHKQLVQKGPRAENDNSFGSVCFNKKEDEICRSIYGGQFDDMDP